MTWTMFENWWNKTEVEKIETVRKCLTHGICVNEENSGLLTQEIEELATKTGVSFVRVWKTFTDVAGMLDKAAGVLKEGVPFEMGTSLRKI